MLLFIFIKPNFIYELIFFVPVYSNPRLKCFANKVLSPDPPTSPVGSPSQCVWQSGGGKHNQSDGPTFLDFFFSGAKRQVFAYDFRFKRLPSLCA